MWKSKFETLGDCETPVSKFETKAFFYYIPFRAWDLTIKKPKTLSAETFKVTVQIELNKMTENSNGSWRKPSNVLR